MGLTTFYDNPNPTFNTVQLMALEVHMSNGITDLLPYVYSHYLSPCNNSNTEGFTLVLVGIPHINQLVSVELARKD